jgi:hypothetical protein
LAAPNIPLPGPKHPDADHRAARDGRAAHHLTAQHQIAVAHRRRDQRRAFREGVRGRIGNLGGQIAHRPRGQGGKTAWGHVDLPRAFQPDRSIGIDRQFHDGRVRQGGIELPEIGVEIAHQ